MSNPRRRASSLFPGILLLFVGLLLLLHNYRGLDIGEVLGHWWPLILIAWGAIKLYERMTASRAGDSESATITSGEVFLVLGLLSLIGIVIAVEIVQNGDGYEVRPMGISAGDSRISMDLDVAVPKKAALTI